MSNRWLTAAILLTAAAGAFAASPATQPGAVAGVTQSNEKHVPLVFTGGYETVGEDRGRPVVLIAAALGVPGEVFRQVFKGVHPAGAGGGPTDAEARANKKVLMDGLGPYGVTDERINEVSNYYRYNRSAGEMWRHAPAEGYATVNGTAVTGVTLTKAGAGYSSVPAVSVDGMPEVKLTAKVTYGKDLATNGRIESVIAGTAETSKP